MLTLVAFRFILSSFQKSACTVAMYILVETPEYVQQHIYSQNYLTKSYCTPMCAAAQFKFKRFFSTGLKPEPFRPLMTNNDGPWSHSKSCLNGFGLETILSGSILNKPHGNIMNGAEQTFL